MSLATVRDKIDNWLSPKWANLVSKQETYFSANGYYFQGLWTHSTDVEQTDALDGDQLADQLNQTPTDQTHDWTDLIQNAFDALPFPARLKIDCYEGPLGHGWVAVLHVKYQGNIYVRSKQVGPEEWRTHDWKLYEPEATP